MESFSISLTLAKASAVHGGNTDHNNRVFHSENVSPERTPQNVSYKVQPIAQAYQALFGEAVAEYNAQQSRPCRRIKDYLAHITESKREEPYYEIVVQFGDCQTVPFGSERRKTAAEMLHEYMKSFQRRNPNLYVYNAVMHMDEATPHLHIDFIPFYTEKRQRGLSKGVSMRAALIEQGYKPQHGMNQLEQWEASEREKMERILRSFGFARDDKHLHRAHLDIDEYKTRQDARRMESLLRRLHSVQPADRTTDTIIRLRKELHSAAETVRKLETEKQSPYQMFYYSSDDKLMYMQQELKRRGIPFREADNGLEAQAYYVREIREIEQGYRSPAVSLRAKLRDDTDYLLMQSVTFEDFIERMQKKGYTIKVGKYLAVRPKDGERFIRFKSLGVDYCERALRRRLRNKLRYEQELDAMVNAAKQAQSPNTLVLKTALYYVISFRKDVLPMRRRDDSQPYSWKNDAVLDRILAFNDALNQGETLQSIRREMAELEQKAADAAKAEDAAAAHLRFSYKLRECIGVVYEGKASEHYTRAAAEAVLRDYPIITRSTYNNITRMVESAEQDMQAAAAKHQELRAALKEKADLLETGEHIMGGGLVAELSAEETRRRQSDTVPNGYVRGNAIRR